MPRRIHLGRGHYTVAAFAFSVSAVLFPRLAPAGPVLPAFSPSNFTPGAPIDNPYFPLVPGTTYRSAARTTDPDTGESGFEVDEDVVTSRTRTIGGVPARVVHARVFRDNVLAEDTTDWYAQDKAGNVWYLGEATSAFTYDKNGKLISTDHSGTWLTGVHGAKPGYIMPAHPKVGFNYYQEFAPADGAVDQAKIVSLDRTVTVPAGHFTHVVRTLESTAAELGVFESKFYAPGVGPILVQEDLDLSTGRSLNKIPLVSVSQGNTPAAVPLPPGVWAGLAGLAAVLFTTARSWRQTRAGGRW
jgi:hypothetical protein